MMRKRPRGFFPNMSDEEIMTYIEENHRGKNLREISKSKDGQVYEIACNRNLIDTLVEKGFLIRNGKKKGFYGNMSDDEVVNYTQ